MSDLSNLSKQRQTILQVKIDGYIEAAMHASKANNLGLSEALSIAAKALVREMAGQGMDQEKARSILMSALHCVFPEREHSPIRYRN